MVFNRRIIRIGLAALCLLLVLHCGSGHADTSDNEGRRAAATSSVNEHDAAYAHADQPMPTPPPHKDAADEEHEEAEADTKQGTTLWKSWYHRATHLLDALPKSSHHLDKEAQRQVDEITRHITLLSRQLLKEERKLEELILAQHALKSSWTWFLDPQIRAAVDAINIQINAQRRVVETIFDEITFLWRQLKPYYGIYSKMFLAELAIFLATPFISFIEFFAYIFSFGLLLFLLVLGPPAFFLGVFALSMGAALLPFLAGALLISWLVEFPSLILQYNPSFLEFMVAYAPFVLATVAMAMSVGRTLGADSLHRRGRAHHKTD